jgi:hypothetical protein
MYMTNIDTLAFSRELQQAKFTQEQADALTCAIANHASIGYAAKADLTDFAKKDDLSIFAKRDDLSIFATKEDFSKFAKKDDLSIFATKNDLLIFATKVELEKLSEKFASKDDVLLLKTELKADIAVLKSDLTSELNKTFRVHTSIIALFGLIVAVAVVLPKITL